MTETKVDIPFVRKVLEFVENEHSDFKHEQGTFILTPAIAREVWGEDIVLTDRIGQGQRKSWRQAFGQDCKTAACIAGTTCLLDPNTEISTQGMPLVNGQQVEWAKHAAGLLGLTDAQAADLFWDMDEDRAIAKLRTHLEALEKAQA